MSNPHPVGKREKGVPNRWTAERLAEMERLYEEARRPGTDKKFAKEQLDELMRLSVTMAAHFQPAIRDMPNNPNADLQEFKWFLQMAAKCATGLAPYQSPTFRAIVVTPAAPEKTTEGGVRRVALRVFEGGRAVKVYAPIIEGEVNAEEQAQEPTQPAEGEAGGGMDVVPDAPGSPEEDR